MVFESRFYIKLSSVYNFALIVLRVFLILLCTEVIGHGAHSVELKHRPCSQATWIPILALLFA